MLCAILIFSAQDAISKHLALHYSPFFVVMLRYWFFALFVVVLAASQAGGLRAAASSQQPLLQCFRGVVLAFEIVVMITGFAALGLAATHAVFAVFPLLVTVLAGPILGERIGWRRWCAVALGFVGMLIIVRPGIGVFDPRAFYALAAAALFAVYQLSTRLVSRTDSAATSLFYTGVAGGVAITLVGPFFWDPMVGWDWGWMLLLCIAGMSGHFFLIQALATAEASVIQPFTFLQLVFASLVGIVIFGETVDGPMILGTILIVAGGLFTFWRERVKRVGHHRAPSAPGTAGRQSP